MPIDINSNSINSLGAKIYNSTKMVTSGFLSGLGDLIC
jgi:hypothetical protein